METLTSHSPRPSPLKNYAEFLARCPNPLREATIVIIRQNGRILAVEKKQGFGSGRVLSGAGGKLQTSEIPEACAQRECKEELSITPGSLKKVATIAFYFPYKPIEKDWNHRVHVFMTDTFSGEPTESDEVAPRWTDERSLPWDRMWPDCQEWLPRVLAGENLACTFFYAEDLTVENREISSA